MANRLQVDLMLNIAAFRIFGAKKFPARGQIEKKRAHFDLRSGRFTALADDVDLAAINDDLCSGNGAGLARG